jgi:hypothetical protein
MKDFIEKIEKIGFKEIMNRRYKYGLWRIDIAGKSCWQLTYTPEFASKLDGNPDILKRVETHHGFIPFDDKEIIKKYFASELREISLGQLGIE